MSKQISITCPHCGKLNLRTASNCTSCGQPLPTSNQPGQQVMQQQLKRHQHWAWGGRPLLCRHFISTSREAKPAPAANFDNDSNTVSC